RCGGAPIAAGPGGAPAEGSGRSWTGAARRWLTFGIRVVGQSQRRDWRGLHCQLPMALTVPTASRDDLESALRLDFRSDTITQPTPAMRQAMAEAAVGDDVFGEDPSINELEAEAARIFHKDAGLFVASGTQGNLLAMLSLTQPGDEVIAKVSSHIANSEVGGAARLGGLTVRPVVGRGGKIQPEQVAASVRPENVHYAHTRLLAIENTHNASGGTVLSLAELGALLE